MLLSLLKMLLTMFTIEKKRNASFQLTAGENKDLFYFSPNVTTLCFLSWDPGYAPGFHSQGTLRTSAELCLFPVL